MIAEDNRKSLMIGIPGVLLQIGSLILPGMLVGSGSTIPDWVVILNLAGPIIGGIMFIIGLGYYAKAKGYSKLLGLLGLLSCLGLIILAILPDKMKDQS